MARTAPPLLYIKNRPTTTWKYSFSDKKQRDSSFNIQVPFPIESELQR